MAMNSTSHAAAFDGSKYALTAFKNFVSGLFAGVFVRQTGNTERRSGAVLRKPTYMQQEEERRTANYLMEIHFH